MNNSEGTHPGMTAASDYEAKPGLVRRSGKALLKIFILLGLMVLLLLCLIWSLAGTDRGFEWALSQTTKRVDGLHIEQPRGNLNTGIAANEVLFKNESVDIQLTNIDTNWRTSCLLQRKFCVDRMEIGKLRVQSLVESNPQTEKKRTDALELPTLNLPLDVTIEEISIKELVFQPPGNAPEQVLTDVRLKAENVGNLVNIEHLFAGYKTFNAAVSGDITLQEDYPLNLNIQLAAKDLVEEHDFYLNVTAANSLSHLQMEAELTGAANGQVRASVHALEPDLPISFQLDMAETGWPLDTHAQLMATDLTVSVDGDLNDFDLSVDTELHGEKIPSGSFAARGMVNPSRILLSEISIQTSDGSATGNWAASLGSHISWVSDISLKDINPEIFSPDINGKIHGTLRANGGVQDGKWMLDLTQGELNGRIRGIPFDINTNLRKTYDDIWDVKRLVVNNGENRIDAKGQYGQLVDFNADINLTQLHNFLPGLAGGFDGTVQLKGNAQSPTVSLDAEATVLKYQDILVTGLQLDANVEQGANRPSGLNLSIEGLQKNTQLVKNTRLHLSGTRAEHTINFFADGPQATAIDLTASGAFNSSLDWLGELHTATVELPAHKVDLTESVELGWNNDIKKARIGAHCWKTEESRLCLKNEVLAEPSGTADIALTRYPLARLDPFMEAGSELQGTLSADASFEWGKDLPGGYNAGLIAKVENGGIKVIDDVFDELTFTYDKFTLDGRANGETIGANLALESKGLGNASLNVTMDPTQETQPIEGDLELSGFDLGFLKAFLPEFEKIGGTVNTRGKLSGNLSEPRFNGQVVLNEPIAQADSLPVQLDGGRVVFNVDGKRAKISGTLICGDGYVALGGDANWIELDNWRADLQLGVDNVNVQFDPVTDSSVNTSLRVALTPGKVQITGDVDVPMARIEVAEIEQGAVVLSNDVIIIEDEEIRAAEEQQAKEASEYQVNVNLSVALGNDVSMEAFGLKAKLGGDMRVSMRPPRPVQLGGEVTIIEGIYKKYGQDLKVTDGQVLFVGPVDNTRLSMEAVREINGEERIAGLRVSGAIKEPAVTLFTEPADKSQDSILSYVLLGRDVNVASDEEQNFLATAALALTLQGGRGRATQLAESLGVEDFALESRGQGSKTEVVVSGRLNDRLLVRYGRSVFTAGNTLYLRYDLTRKLYLEAAQGIARAVDVFYSFSF